LHPIDHKPHFAPGVVNTDFIGVTIRKAGPSRESILVVFYHDNTGPAATDQFRYANRFG